MRKIILMILSAALMAACGDDGGSSVVKLNADQQEQVETSSQALVESGAEVGALKTDPGAEMTFASLGSVFGSASALWSTKMAAKAGSAGSPYDTAYGTLESSKFALTTDCYTVSGDTVTYDCNEAGYGIVGSVTVSGDTIEIDLALETQGYTFIYTGKITVTDTLIDGWLAFDYTVDQTGMTFAYDVRIDYNSVELVGGCPVNGNLEVSVDVDIDGLEGLPAGAASAYNFPSARIEFGPECGDIALF